MSELDQLVTLLSALFPDRHVAPEQLSKAEALQRVIAGEPIDAVSRDTGFTRSNLRTWANAITAGYFYKWVRRKPPTEERLQRARAGIAQMMLGFLAEAHFETSAHKLLESGGFSIRDDRSAGSDTDYRLIDSDGRAVSRLNVKFHGTLFRDAKNIVGLEPEDCFALATYKIHSALQRQTSEAVPYVFLVVTVPSLPRSFVEGHIEDDYVWLSAVSGRVVEEAIARKLLTESWAQRLHTDIEHAEFRVISASRAFRLMHEKLFDRVFALRVRAFNWTYRGAEVDMHLSLHTEMISFREFVAAIEERGVRETAIRLDRGEI